MLFNFRPAATLLISPAEPFGSRSAFRERIAGMPPTQRQRPVVIIRENEDLRGDFHTDDPLEVYGLCDGTLSAPEITIDFKGQVTGTIVAERAIINGRVMGAIKSNHVTLWAAAHVEGEIWYTDIAIEEGAFVDAKLIEAEKDYGDEFKR